MSKPEQSQNNNNLINDENNNLNSLNNSMPRMNSNILFIYLYNKKYIKLLVRKYF